MLGWIKIHRKIKEKGWYKDSQFVHLWLHLLIEANHKEKEFLFNGEIVKLKPGQLLTGRKRISNDTGINESKVQRGLKLFEKETQIEQQTNNRNRIISITNWDQYQLDEQPVNNQRTTNEQPVNTNKNVNKGKNEKNEEEVILIVDYLNKKTDSKYKASTPKTKKHINARIEEGYQFEDFKAVIDKKHAQWGEDAKMAGFLRPETLFGSKFEGYLNEKAVPATYREKKAAQEFPEDFKIKYI